MTIAAIPTDYRGYRFRSRLEARWAVFFDTLSLPFEYELQGYSTDVGWYLPDFWFPTLKMFGEVKPDEPSREALAKCAAVAHGTGYPFVMLVGTPDDREYIWIHPKFGALKWWSGQFVQLSEKVREMSYAMQHKSCVRQLNAAVVEARGARFGT